LVAALVASGAAAEAAPASEPLIITKQSDSLLTVTPSGAAQPDNSVDGVIERFGRVLGQAIRAQDQAVETACKSVQRPKPGSAAVYAWGERCGYQRY
jgi:hypothetical protein